MSGSVHDRPRGSAGRGVDLRNYPPRRIAIRLSFEEMPDGRAYVTSPDLTGFHAMVDVDEDPTAALLEPLRLFLSQYLGAEIADIGPGMAPVSYRAHMVGIPLTDHKRPDLLWAAVA